MNALLRTLALGLALVAVVALPACDSDGNGGNITATGTVTNNFGRPVQGATVTFTGTSAAPGGQAAALAANATCSTNASGQFSCTGLEAGTYTVTISVPGYTTATFTATVDGSGNVAISGIPQIAGTGNINALIVNALNGSPVGGAAIECRRELSAGTFGGVEFTGTTNAAGEFVLANTFFGNAACTATVAGISLPFGMTIAQTGTTGGTIGAVPPTPAGTYRVVLTWGQNPSDLDSHLTGPDGAGDRFHVYYGNPSFGEHNLDLDDVTSFGPETITIVPGSVNGLYRYSVHNYSNQGATGAAEIYNSPTRVDLYGQSGLIRTFTAPAPTAANGGTDADTWRVFEMTVNGSNVTFNPASGTAGLGYVQATGPSDMGTFLTGGFPAKGAAN